jgi:hypothetical protein
MCRTNGGNMVWGGMPDVSRSDSQRSDSSRPRVSFNRDVHVKRISKSRINYISIYKYWNWIQYWIEYFVLRIMNSVRLTSAFYFHFYFGCVCVCGGEGDMLREIKWKWTTPNHRPGLTANREFQFAFLLYFSPLPHRTQTE